MRHECAVVAIMGSRSEGRGFKSQRRILDRHDIFTLICFKNYNDACLKRPKINKKEAGVGPIFIKKDIAVPLTLESLFKNKVFFVFFNLASSGLIFILVFSIQFTGNKIS